MRDHPITVEWLCNMLIAECPVIVEYPQHRILDSFLAGEVQNSQYKNAKVLDYNFTTEVIKIRIPF